MAVLTRRQAPNVSGTQAAVNAIGNRANYTLKKLLGIKRKPVRRLRPAHRCSDDTAALRREIQRLRGVIDSLKAGRAKAVQRAVPRPNFRTANLFEKQAFMIAGQPYQLPEITWKDTQRTNANNRASLFRRARRFR